MNKIVMGLMSALILTFAGTAQAENKCAREVLDQVRHITSSYQPVMNSSWTVVKKKGFDVVVMRMYDTGKNEADPEESDMQVVFIRHGKVCALAALVFPPLDATKYIDVLADVKLPEVRLEIK